MKPMFETQTCTRCGGEGRYSWNALNGSVCFKCRGKKVILTKRGAAALKFYNDKRRVECADLKPGDKVWTNILLSPYGETRRELVEFVGVADKPTAWQISGVGESAVRVPMIRYDFVRKNGEAYGICGGTPVHRIPTEEDIAEAMAYQAALTKAGKPMKRGLDPRQSVVL